ncbi:MAG: hypothetical protein J7555_11025, partial [Chloroflexi bacterium]|nr:hypothetical protein [Chloroflexota bacterium]
MFVLVACLNEFVSDLFLDGLESLFYDRPPFIVYRPLCGLRSAVCGRSAACHLQEIFHIPKT